MSNEHITDEQIVECALAAGFAHDPSRNTIWATDGGIGVQVTRGLRDFARAILALRPAAQPVGWKTEALRLFDLYAANLLNNANAQATSTRDSFRALLSVPPAAQPAVPVGWQLVPVVPTMEMLGAFFNACPMLGDEGDWERATDEDRQEVANEWAAPWAAMLSAAPAALPVGEPVAISDHEKDCATCAHQTLPPYVPKCQQCNRLATGARRNWQAQPVPERVPMSREDLKAFMDESGYGHVTAQERADFINGFRSAEAHHRITTPSNQPTRTE